MGVANAITEEMGRNEGEVYVDAEPYPWPYNGNLRPDNTTLIIIDTQNDFCSPGGYVDSMGYDPANRRWRSRQMGAGIGDEGPMGCILVRGEKGGDIIPELCPIEGEVIIEKPGKGSFYATDLELVLHRRGIENIVLAGVTTDVCVHTTMRDANDRGFECLLLEDCCAAIDQQNQDAAAKMIKMQSGVFGAASNSRAFLAALP